jgi:hypothetical protein
MARTLLLALLVSAVFSPSARAQPAEDTPPTVALSFWKCSRAGLDQIIATEFAQGLPVYQSFVDNGRIFEAGTLRHAWGDEYNYVSYIVGPDIATVVAASDEINEAYTERYPNENAFLEHCTEHFDNIYTAATGQGFHGDVTPDDPATVVLSFWKCPLPELGRLVQNARAMQPMADAITEEGTWRGSGFMTHSWGDAWNLVRYTGADDLEAVMTGFDELTERSESVEQEGDDPNVTCSAHRDNIYDLVLRTTPRDG